MLNSRRQQTLITIRWWCRQIVTQVGWIPVVVVLCCLFGAAQQLHAIQVYRATLIALQPRIAQARLTHRHGSPIVTTLPAIAAAPVDDQAEMSDMLTKLPVPSDLHGWMLDILKTAKKHHVLLNVGDYQWHPGTLYTATRIQQFDMRFVIESDYQTSRHFVTEILNQHPTLALTGWEMRKNETTQSVVESTLTFSVFMRSES